MVSFYRNAFNEIYQYIKYSSLIFILSILIGIFLIEINNSYIQNNIKQLMDIADKIAQKDNTAYTIYYIFKNNLSVAIVMIISGIFFGILPILVLISNGVMIGYFVQLIVLESSQEVGFFLAGILPHGIFELPAIIISASLGMRLGFNIFMRTTNFIRKKSMYSVTNFRQIIKNTLIIFLSVVSLLFIAAIVESTITGYILNKLFIL